MTRMIIMAGGTGGHVIPALAVAFELMARNVSISWIGSREGLESRLVPESGIEIDCIDIKGLRRSGLVRKLAMPLILVKALFQTFGVMRHRKPDAVLGMGGFVSGPGGIVSRLLGIPLILHEQNSVAGLTNRWLAKVSGQVLSGFPVARGITNPRWIGNPVRKEILQIPEPATRLRGRRGALRILVVGGSQGASVFNENLPELLGRLSDVELDVWHQCGQHGGADINIRYRSFGITSRVQEFIDDMAVAYSWCDIIICRSGAMTVAEVCAAGAAALFVPYPYAVNDHQTENANYLVSQRAAYLAPQSGFVNGDWLPQITRIANNREILIAVCEESRKLGKPDASAQLAEVCMEVINA